MIDVLGLFSGLLGLGDGAPMSNLSGRLGPWITALLALSLLCSAAAPGQSGRRKSNQNSSSASEPNRDAGANQNQTQRKAPPSREVSSEHEPVYRLREVDKPPIILKKPNPRYTEQARRHAVSGRVILSAVFSSGGRLIDFRVVAGLRDGLTESAMDAAYAIRFEPAQKDGQPVSVRLNVEYNFNVY